jgi:nitrite reductase (NADH) small subunit/3-phenylpropionate/trans-cinnamate dioxygenase ferredoxin subunit
MSTMHQVAQTKDLEPGQGLAVEVEGKKIALFNIEGSYHAIDDACTHVGGSLSEGSVEGTVVTCPLHGARFDVTNGEVLSPPARTAAGSYKVHINGDAISLEIS